MTGNGSSQLGVSVTGENSVDDQLAEAKQALQSGDLNKGAQLCQAVLAQDSQNAEALFLLGRFCEHTGQLPGAAECYSQAAQFDPDNIHNLIDLGRVYIMLQQGGRAVEVLSKATAQDPENVEVLYRLGVAYTLKNELENAVKWLNAAIEKKPDFTDAYLALVPVQEVLNDIDGAEENLKKVYEIAPDHPIVLHMLAKISRRKGEDLAVVRDYLEKAKQGTSDKRVLGEVSSELGKVLDKLGEYDNAYQEYAHAQTLFAQVHAAQGAGQPSMFNQLLKGFQHFFNEDFVKDWSYTPKKDDKAPVFLVGFPRSGTTLTEQILASHPNVIATDEQEFLLGTFKSLKMLGTSVDIPTCFQEFTENHIKVIRNDYWRQVEEFLGEDSGDKCLIDKLPINVTYLGYIYRIFPDAKILMLIRDPRDACFSCFTQSFVDNPTMTNFYTLEDTVNTYTQVMDLYLRYKEFLPLDIMELRYEDLVDDLEGNARKLLEFTGQEWDEQVLRYYESGRVVTTPSYEGVTQPIYKGSIGRWKHYAQHFEPHKTALERFIQTFGYEV